MSHLKLRGYFVNKEGSIYATIPSLDLSKIHTSADTVLELILKSFEEYKITLKLVLIEGNGFTIESTADELEKFIIARKCS